MAEGLRWGSPERRAPSNGGDKARQPAWTRTEVAFDGLGLLFANRSTATILALAKSRGSE